MNDKKKSIKVLGEEKSLLEIAKENTSSFPDRHLARVIEETDKKIKVDSYQGYKVVTLHFTKSEEWMAKPIKENYEKQGFTVEEKNRSLYIRWE